MTQAWDKTLRARGYRVTPQRQLVLAAVTKLEHATPEDIWAEVQQTASGVNISTIYRALELLEQLGLVTHTHLGHGAPPLPPGRRSQTCAPGLLGMRPHHRGSPRRGGAAGFRP